MAWLKDQLGLIETPEETETLASGLPDNGGVYLVPAFVGLGAPYWREDARAAIVGLTPHATRAHLARAALEAIAYQIRDVLDAMAAEASRPLVELSADGGMVDNAFLVQFIADVARVAVRASTVPELSALGAALAGMLGHGMSRLARGAEAPRPRRAALHPADAGGPGRRAPRRVEAGRRPHALEGKEPEMDTRNRIATIGAFALAIHASAPAGPLAGAEPRGPHRMIVLTDIEADPDDTQSLVRLLLYSEGIDIQGLIATTSTHLRTSVHPDSIRAVIRAYATVHRNLLMHDPRYPRPEVLEALVKRGRAEYGMAGVGAGKDSEGSEWIIRALDADDDRPLWVSVWGGANTLAQALHTLRATRAAPEVDRLVRKLRVYTISDQDDSGPWMRKEFPSLFYVVSSGRPLRRGDVDRRSTPWCPGWTTPPSATPGSRPTSSRVTDRWGPPTPT